MVINNIPEQVLKDFDHIKSVTGISRTTFVKSKLTKIIDDFYTENPARKPK